MKKKILIVTFGMEPGGIERSLLGLLDETDYDKYEIDLFLFTVGGAFLPLVNENVRILPQNKACAAMTLPIKQAVFSAPGVAAERTLSKIKVRKKYGFSDAASFALLSEYHRSCLKFFPKLKKEYDLVIAYCWPHDFAAKNVKAKKKLALIHTDYGAAAMDFEKDEKLWSVFDGIAAVSDDVGKAFADIYPSLKDRIFTAENVLPVRLIEKQASEKPQIGLRKRDEKIILSVGRLTYQKAFDEAAESAAIMKKDGFDFKWYIIGFGPDEELIKSKISEYGVEDRFILLGKTDNPYPYYKKCDIYVQPSRYEGKSVTVREAQHLGCPVLITRYPTASSQVEDGTDGVICDMGPENVAKALENMIKDETLCKKLSENCLKRDYSNSSQVPLLLDF